MSVLYIRKDSPYIWLKYYDKTEGDPHKRQKAFSTKIKNTREGWKIARELQRRFDVGLVESQIFRTQGITVRPRITLSRGFNEFLNYKIMKPKTAQIYQLAVQHFQAACGDKSINDYTRLDAKKFIKYMETAGLAPATQGIFTRHLAALWNFFIKKDITKENIIFIVKPPRHSPQAIPINDMRTILNYFKSQDVHQYHLIYFLLLTGFRVSTALSLEWKDVDLQNGIISALNVKANRTFYFPIHFELRQLLEQMKGEGRLFDYAPNTSPSFWRRTLPELVKQGKISRRYTLHQIRKTFGTWLANSGVDRAVVKELLDHSTINVTNDHYVQNDLKSKQRLIEHVRFAG